MRRRCKSASDVSVTPEAPRRNATHLVSKPVLTAKTICGAREERASAREGPADSLEVDAPAC